VIGFKRENLIREVKKRSMGQEALARLTRNKTAMVGFAIMMLVVILVCCAGLICPEGYDHQIIPDKFIRPGSKYLLGTDDLGRSLLARVLYGGRYSLFIGVAATVVSSVFGVILGSIAGYYGGKVDNAIMRTLDVLNAIPNLLLAIAISSVLGGGMYNAILAIGISSLPTFAMTVRGPILAVKGQEYVEAARALDAKDSRIVLKYIIPNVLSPIVIQVTGSVSGSILAAASLSFLGLGVQPPIPEWGTLLSTARQFIREAPYLVTIPGLCIALVVLSTNLFGDGLRDALDPKLKY